MNKNKMKATWHSGGAVTGGWCAIPSSFSAELVASVGFDYVCVDMQHGLADYGDLLPMLQAIAIHGPTPIVRVPAWDVSTAQRALDAGAEGIVFPLVSTREQAEAASAACHYPPAGHRSFGPIRSRLHLGPEPKNANAEVACIVMIETQEGVDNLEEIISCPGVDAIYVGPNDLGLALGLEVGAVSPELDGAIAHILEVCRSRGLPAGIHTTSGAAAAGAIKQGFAMATVTTDAALLSAAYKAEFMAMRGIVADQRTGVYG